MKTWVLWVCAAVCSAAAVAQEGQRDVELRLVESERQLMQAEERLQAAAAEVARLSRELSGGGMERVREFALRTASRPRLGLQLETREVNGRRETRGVDVVAVMPDSPAQRAGVRAGDILLAVDGETLEALTAGAAVRRIGNLLEDGEPGDEVQVLIERDGDERDLVIVLDDNARATAPHAQAFAFANGDHGLTFHLGDEGTFEFLEGGEVADVEWLMRFGGPWAAIELVELSPGLGEYFGVDGGLLVVRAPENDVVGFEDGDVIRRIGGRTPSDVGHAMRILRSYAPGESLEVEITRQRRSQTLSIEVPEQTGQIDVPHRFEWRSGALRRAAPVAPVAPVVVPLAPAAPVPLIAPIVEHSEVIAL